MTREELDVKMKDRGMISLQDLIDAEPSFFHTHAAVHDHESFEWWLEHRRKEMLTLRCEYAVNDPEEDDELYEWVMAHSATLEEVWANWRKANKE